MAQRVSIRGTVQESGKAAEGCTSAAVPEFLDASGLLRANAVALGQMLGSPIAVQHIHDARPEVLHQVLCQHRADTCSPRP